MPEAPGPNDTPPGTGGEIIVASPEQVPIVADTAGGLGGVVEASAALLAAQSDGRSATRIGIYEEFHAGPIPSARTLRELVEIYPDAAKDIFAEFKAQGRHRRSLEAKRIESGIERAKQGQWIAGWLGTLTIGGGILIGALGHPVWGFAAVVTALGTLAAVFLYRADKQGRNLAAKQQTRADLARGESVEKLETDDPDDRESVSESPIAPNPPEPE